MLVAWKGKKRDGTEIRDTHRSRTHRFDNVAVVVVTVEQHTFNPPFGGTISCGTTLSIPEHDKETNTPWARLWIARGHTPQNGGSQSWMCATLCACAGEVLLAMVMMQDRATSITTKAYHHLQRTSAKTG